jgi:hypothetical protein
LQSGKASKEIVKSYSSFHSRQRSTETEMDTVTERDVRIDVADYVEFFRPFKVF